MNDMFRLWCLGEEDLLSERKRYKLSDTGQGKQRLQQSPHTFKAMQARRSSVFQNAMLDEKTALAVSTLERSMLISIDHILVLVSFARAEPHSVNGLCLLERFPEHTFRARVARSKIRRRWWKWKMVLTTISGPRRFLIFNSCYGCFPARILSTTRAACLLYSPFGTALYVSV